MRAYDILYEHVDQRSTIDKLRDVIAHPATDSNIRSIAQTKLETLMANQPQQALVEYSYPPVETNLTYEQMERPFIVGITIRELYDRLCALQPGPSTIHFMRQGQVYMMVPPPFQGVSKAQYLQMVNQAAIGVRRITSTYVEEKGYMFTLSFI